MALGYECDGKSNFPDRTLVHGGSTASLGPWGLSKVQGFFGHDPDRMPCYVDRQDLSIHERRHMSDLRSLRLQKSASDSFFDGARSSGRSSVGKS